MRRYKSPQRFSPIQRVTKTSFRCDVIKTSLTYAISNYFHRCHCWSFYDCENFSFSFNCTSMNSAASQFNVISSAFEAARREFASGGSAIINRRFYITLSSAPGRLGCISFHKRIRQLLSSEFVIIPRKAWQALSVHCLSITLYKKNPQKLRQTQLIKCSHCKRELQTKMWFLCFTTQTASLSCSLVSHEAWVAPSCAVGKRV